MSNAFIRKDRGILMLVGTLAVKDFLIAQQEIEKVKDKISCIELRLDFLEEYNLESITSFINSIPIKKIITLRSSDQGGHFKGSEKERLIVIKAIIKNCKVEYIDLEYTISTEFLTELKRLYPNIKIIRSFHNFKETPKNLKNILEDLIHPDVDFYKIITFANSTIDSLRILTFLQEYGNNFPLIMHAMGEEGIPSRILGQIFGNCWTYVALEDDKQIVLHSLTLTEAHEIYRIDKITPTTKIYGLIGDPVDTSIGHIFHNNFFHENNINAIYVKLRINPDELKQFFPIVCQLLFFGLSVTMPLKEYVKYFIMERSIDLSINTLKIENQKITGINTDGIATIDLIEQQIKVKNKKVLILGAGGSAKGILNEAYNREALITIYNRTVAKSKALADYLNCSYLASLDEFTDKSFDIIINTIPLEGYKDCQLLSALTPILKKRPLVMDIVYKKDETPLLEAAHESRAPVIYGKDMFIAQAKLQLDYLLEQQNTTIT